MDEFRFKKFLVVTFLITGVLGYTVWLAYNGNAPALAVLMVLTHGLTFLMGHLLNQRSVERTMVVNSRQDREMIQGVTEGVRALTHINRSLAQTANHRFEQPRQPAVDDYVIDVSPDVAGLLDEAI